MLVHVELIAFKLRNVPHYRAYYVLSTQRVQKLSAPRIVQTLRKHFCQIDTEKAKLGICHARPACANEKRCRSKVHIGKL